jgi:hypothetical protein
MGGLEIFGRLRELAPRLPVVVMIARYDVQTIYGARHWEPSISYSSSSA